MKNKRISIFIVLFCLMGALQAQPAEKMTSQQLNLRGKVSYMQVNTYKAGLKDGEIQRQSLVREIQYSFTKQGDLSEQKNYANDKLQRRFVYQYDNNGRETKKVWYNSRGNVYQTYISKYAGGNMSAYLVFNGNDVLLDSTVYVYADNQLSTENHFLSDTADQCAFYFTFKYNNNGKMLSKQKVDGSQIFLVDQYAYDAKNRISEEKKYDKNGELVADYLFTYDDEDQIVVRKSINEQGASRRRITYSYDQYGNLVEEIWYDKETTFILREISNTYTYDDKGNWISRITYEGPDKNPTEIVVRSIDYYR